VTTSAVREAGQALLIVVDGSPLASDGLEAWKQVVERG
jgi:hypothetical protein